MHLEIYPEKTKINTFSTKNPEKKLFFVIKKKRFSRKIKRFHHQEKGFRLTACGNEQKQVDLWGSFGIFENKLKH